MLCSHWDGWCFGLRFTPAFPWCVVDQTGSITSFFFPSCFLLHVKPWRWTSTVSLELAAGTCVLKQEHSWAWASQQRCAPASVATAAALHPMGETEEHRYASGLLPVRSWELHGYICFPWARGRAAAIAQCLPGLQRFGLQGHMHWSHCARDWALLLMAVGDEKNILALIAWYPLPSL